MPPEPLIDLSQLDLDHVAVDREGIYQVNPHRYEFQQLTGIYACDHEKGYIVGYRDIGEDEFWVRGHIPGRPLFPGVLMIEAAAQLVSYYVMTLEAGGKFLGFAGVDDVKFRGTVEPGQEVILMGRMIDIRPRRCIGQTQAYVDGKMVYEGKITGMWL